MRRFKNFKKTARARSREEEGLTKSTLMGAHKRRKRVSKGKEKSGRSEERRFGFLLSFANCFCFVFCLAMLHLTPTKQMGEVQMNAQKTLNLLYASVSLGKYFCDFFLPRPQSPASMSVDGRRSLPLPPPFPLQAGHKTRGEKRRKKSKMTVLNFICLSSSFLPLLPSSSFSHFSPFQERQWGKGGGESKVSSP